MSARNDLRDNVRDDERRRRDEAKIAALQQQVDELRQMTRELMSRQGRNEEQFRNYEVGLAQARAVIEQHRHEVSQATQARQLEDARVRQQMTELDARIEETGRPIRSLQAHIAEVLETIRRGRDDTHDEQRRYDELKTVIEHVAALSERTSGLTQITRDSIDSLRTDLEQTQRDLLKAEDSTKIVEQEVRRRMAEVGQETLNLNARIEDMRPLFAQLDAEIDDVRASIVHIDPALEELAHADEQMQEEIARFYGQTVERDDLLSERIEEIRRHMDAQARDQRQLVEQRFDRLNTRVDEQVDHDRELAYRLNLIEMTLDELRDVDVKLRRELWQLHEARTRWRLDQLQAELESVSEQRRAAEHEMQSARPERSERPDRSDRSDRGTPR